MSAPTSAPETFKSVFPIGDFAGRSVLEFVSYELEIPKYDVEVPAAWVDLCVAIAGYLATCRLGRK